jgi:hypothetical protein
VDALLFCPKNEDSGTYARLAALPGAEKTYCFQAYKARLKRMQTKPRDFHF